MVTPFRRLLVACALVLGFASLLSPAGVGAQKATFRDWEKEPVIVEVDTERDIFAVGDVHGDYERLLDVLKAGGIISEAPERPEAARWRAGPAVLVCPGDFINKWDQSLRVIALFRALAAAAAREGGRVIVTAGNHEAEFLADPRGDKLTVFADELRRNGLKPADVAAGRDREGIGAYLRGLPFAARVNDWFFIHAGNPAGLSLRELRSGLERGLNSAGYRSPFLLGPDSPLEVRLHPRPWWERDGDRPADAQARLRASVRALGVNHLVIGHQPGPVDFCDGTKRKKGTMAQKFDGLIFLIDAGMSRGCDDTREGFSRGALLRIRGGATPRATAFYPDGATERLWP